MVKSFSLLFLGLFATLVLISSAQEAKNDDVKTAFMNFVKQFGKTYATDEELSNRFEIFKQNYATVHEMNKENPGVFGVTKFSDLTTEEFKAKYLTFKPNSPEAREMATGLYTPPEQAIPTSFDWRTKGAVTAVKDQGQCGSCWAFSTAEEVESMWFMAGNKLVELSPQQIVSCDKGNGDQGCNGGDTVTAYTYVKKNGLELESSYPYKSGDSGSDGTCKFDKTKVVAHISGFTYAASPCKDSCQKQNETQLAAALASKGPVSICVYAESWQFYSKGVFKGNCPKAYSSLDHCVQLVGYDKTDAKNPYWIVRNSWGTSWGIDGYIHIEFGKNLCGIADEATFATAA